jgi:hypothetical protein
MSRKCWCRRLAVGGAFVFGFAALPIVVDAQSSNTIVACVKLDADQVRIVAANQACSPHEARISWNIVGPAGAPGSTGPMGPAGQTGPVGPVGPAGATGAQGPIGSAGPSGPAGSTGATGAQGYSVAIAQDDGTGCGASGGVKLTLVDGNGLDVANTTPAFACNGARGASGAKGDMGPIGPVGAAGAKGDSGAMGPIGAPGAKGDKGDKGDTGAIGPAGAAGPQGSAGASGPGGAQGPTGPQGLQGVQGQQGTPGSILVGAQNWTPGALVQVPNLPNTGTFTTLAGSGFVGTTHGGPLLIQVLAPFVSNGGTVACQPSIDGLWAGSKAFPAIDPFNVTKEGFFGGTGYVLWSTSRVYSNVAAGVHQFSIQCWIAGPVSYVSATAVASITVIEM